MACRCSNVYKGAEEYGSCPLHGSRKFPRELCVATLFSAHCDCGGAWSTVTSRTPVTERKVAGVTHQSAPKPLYVVCHSRDELCGTGGQARADAEAN